MARIPVDRTVCLLLALFLLPWAGLAVSSAPAAPQSLHLRLATFDPLRDPLPAGRQLGPLSPGPFLIQFAYPMTGREKPAIEAAGGTVEGYIPDGGFVVVGPLGLAAARQIPGFRWMGLLPPSLRVSPDADTTESVTVLWSGDAAAAVNGFSSVGARVLS